MSDPSEQWRPIAGFDGRYEVSDRGRVRSWVRGGTQPVELRAWIRRAEPKMLRIHAMPSGYQYVMLTTRWDPDHKFVHCYVHRLVLEAFVGPSPEGMESCHFDGTRTNNRLDNLRWDTRSANALDRERHGTSHPFPKGNYPARWLNARSPSTAGGGTA